MKTIFIIIALCLSMINVLSCQSKKIVDEMGIYLLDTIIINKPRLYKISEGSKQALLLIDSSDVLKSDKISKKTLMSKGYLFNYTCNAYKDIEQLLYEKRVKSNLILPYKSVVIGLKKLCDSEEFYLPKDSTKMYYEVNTNKFLYYIVNTKYLKSRRSENTLIFNGIDNLFIKVLVPIR